MKTFLTTFLALPLLALLAALLSNGLASPSRHLAWRGEAPAPVVATAAAQPLPSPAEAPSLPKPRSAPPAPAAAMLPKESHQPEEAKPAFEAPWDPEHLVREISSEEAEAAFRAGLPFVDARRSEEYEAGHVRGASSLPVWEDGLAARLEAFAARAAFQARAARLKAPVVLYCLGGECEDSRLLADRMIPLGFGNLLIYRDGFPDWAAKGRPVVKGPERP
jgi:rhodanese-related sulfurtransferase